MGSNVYDVRIPIKADWRVDTERLSQKLAAVPGVSEVDISNNGDIIVQISGGSGHQERALLGVRKHIIAANKAVQSSRVRA